MKNLIVLNETRHSLPSSQPSPSSVSSKEDDTFPVAVVPNPNVDHTERHLHPSTAPVGVGGDEVYDFVLLSDGILSAVDAGDGIIWTTDLSASYQEDGRKAWIHLSYVEATDVLVVLSHCGTMVSIDPTNGEGELIGAFDYGIECALWSTDGEVLALVTYQPQEQEEEEGEDHNSTPAPPSQPAMLPVLTTMNTHYEILSETSLPPHLPSTPISLAWSRRAESPSVAVSTIDSEDNTRRVRIYDGSTLEFRSEGRSEDGSGRVLTNLLEHPAATKDQPTTMANLAWAGDGTSNLLACVQKKGKKNRWLIFLEPNGLQHGGCKLDQRMEGDEVVGLQWNAESDLVAVAFLSSGDSQRRTSAGVGNEEEEKDDRPFGKIQLYHRCNYHWYVKYELTYERGTVVSSLSFDPVQPYDLTVSLRHSPKHHPNDRPTSSTLPTTPTHPREWRRYRFVWDPSTVSHDGLATVVDGRYLNCTHLDAAIVPPPMYAYRLEWDVPVVGVAHVPDSLRDVAGICGVGTVVHLNDGRVAVCGRGGNTSSGVGNDSIVLGYVDLSAAMDATVDSDGIEGGGVDGSSDTSRLRQVIVTNLRLEEGRDDGTVLIDLLAVRCATPSLPARFSEDLLCFTVRLGRGEVGPGIGSIAKTIEVVAASIVALEGRALRIVNWSNSPKDDVSGPDDTVSTTGAGQALIELVDGTLFEFVSYTSTGLAAVHPCEAEPALMEPCPHLAGLQTSPTSRLIFGLSSRSRLYCGERLISSSSSSFAISTTHRFLSYVALGSRSQLRFVPLAVLTHYDPLMGSDEDQRLLGGEGGGGGYEPRDVERGSRLVVVLHRRPAAVLQLPRGNLEAVSPRALVLPHLFGLVEDGEYRIALDVMRRQRVDTNLLVDTDAKNFLEVGVETLVEQVRNVDHLNLFIACLQNADITEWKHVVPSWFREGYMKKGKGGVDHHDDAYSIGVEDLSAPKPNVGFDFSTKVNQVCRRMRAVMMEAEKKLSENLTEGYFLLPILSTFAKEDPPQLDKALALIKTNAESAATQTVTTDRRAKKSVLLSEKAQSSIQYLAFLADYELLFRTALGMYNFPLAKAVARNSQMDPKVYLPLLKRYTVLPTYTARYEVDLELKRYDLALENLYRSGRVEDTETYGVESFVTIDDSHFEVCLRFIEEHKLQKRGLELFHTDPVRHRRITISLGERLLRENQNDLALSVFLSVVNDDDSSAIDGARRASRECGDWRTYFCLVLQMHGADYVNDPTFRDDAAEVAEEIAAGKGGKYTRKKEGYEAASRILVEYCNDVPGAVDMLVSAESWFEGRRLAGRHGDKASEERVVDGAEAYGDGCLEDFTARADRFVAALKTYAECLELRKTAMREGEDGGEGGGDGVDHDDSGSLFSMASTASNASVRSNMSSSSVGSIGSVTSVISAGGVSSFSLLDDDANKHKSRFNKIGRGPGGTKKKKKRKPSRREKQRYKRGSEEELQSVVKTLKANVVNDDYLEIVEETIQFLVQVDKVSMAKDLYEAYESARMVVENAQVDRIESLNKKKKEEEQKARREGHHFENVTHSCEEEVDLLRCSTLPAVIHNFFSYLIC